MASESTHRESTFGGEAPLPVAPSVTRVLGGGGGGGGGGGRPLAHLGFCHGEKHVLSICVSQSLTRNNA